MQKWPRKGCRKMRRNCGCVSQDVTLFYGTLRENIAFGLPYADDSAVVAAAEVAGMTEFVNRHPRGFDMPVGERGARLFTPPPLTLPKLKEMIVANNAIAEHHAREHDSERKH